MHARLHAKAMRPYAWALLIALAAALLQGAIRPWVGERVPFVIFLTGVMVAAGIGGRGPGVLVLLAGLVNAVYWLEPTGRLQVADPADRTSLVLFVFMGTVIAAFGNRIRQMAERSTLAEDRLMLAVEDTGIGLFDIDLVAQTAYASPSLSRLAGLPATDAGVPLQSWLAQVPAMAVAESRAVLAQKLREKASAYERELQLEREDGSVIWLLVRVHIAWDDERALRVRGACIDITERKAVTAKLEATRTELAQQVDDLHGLYNLSSRLLENGTLAAQLQTILVNVLHIHGARRGLVCVLDPDTDQLEVVASLGLSRQGLEQFTRMGHGEAACRQACDTRERVVIDDIERAPGLAQLREMARAEGFCAVHSTPLISPGGNLFGAVAVHLDTCRGPSERERRLTDICARKAAIFIERTRAQAAMEQTQGRFRVVLESSAVPFAVLAPVRDEKGRITDFCFDYVNGAAAHAIGRSVDELTHHRVGDALPGHWSAGNGEFEQYVAVADLHETREFELQPPVRDGGAWFHCVASPMHGTVGLWFADITERKRAQAQMQQDDRRKDEFLATLAHELRNPLAPIRQAAALGREPGATDAQKLWSQQVIERQVQHMALLLDDLLDVSRITRGALSLRRTRTQLADVVDAAVETARPSIDEKQHRFTLRLPEHPVWFEADALRISQVVANLLTNAAKYTDAEGSIWLTASQTDDEVVIEVSDNGRGIPAASVPEVFRMFTQLDNTSDRTGTGLGIGLALTKGLVELHGGSIAVRSAGRGLGSTFSVRLPTGPQQVAAVPEALLDTPLPDRARLILIADDNQDAASSLAMLLRLQGHETLLAHDGEQALSTYRLHEPDICLLDIGMPQRNGNSVAQAIRESNGGARPLLVAITGWGQDSDRDRALAAGFDHHMTKPVDLDKLERLIGGRTA
jgi:PAS domain S-box-containing protein